VVPLIDSFTIPIIEKCLSEITEKTSVKRFQHNGLWFIHSLNWTEHQELRRDRLGLDDMPDYSGTTPELVPLEVEVEVEYKEADRLKYFAFLFENIWKRYPKKSGKEPAKKYFLDEVKTLQRYAEMCTAMSNYIAMLKSERTRTIKDGQGWFNPSYWVDYIDWNPPSLFAEESRVASAMRGVK